jgi:hypothetical protein
MWLNLSPPRRWKRNSTRFLKNTACKRESIR